MARHITGPSCCSKDRRYLYENVHLVAAYICINDQMEVTNVQSIYSVFGKKKLNQGIQIIINCRNATIYT
jgi:hypothetical protein